MCVCVCACYLQINNAQNILLLLVKVCTELEQEAKVAYSTYTSLQDVIFRT